jgi:FkbM family methyltransferase
MQHERNGRPMPAELEVERNGRANYWSFKAPASGRSGAWEAWEQPRPSKLQMLARIRSTFKGWLFPTMFIPVASLLASGIGSAFLENRLSRKVTHLTLRHNNQTVWAPLLDVWPLLEIFALGAYDFPMVDWNRIRTVVDCGAHVGGFSLWVGQRVPCRIVAVEPNPLALALCERNFAAAGIDVSLVRKAVAGDRGPRRLGHASIPGISSISRRSSGRRSIDVEAVTLQDLLSHGGMKSVDLMKMDVEGAEEEIFASVSTATLASIGAAIIECHPAAGVRTESIAAKLVESGMDVLWQPRMIVGWRT